MIKIILFIFGLICLMGLSACEIKTPEIHGLVLDAETKQPVEGAWIRAVAGVKSKTVAGDVGSVIGLHQPHTRTGKDGKFLIPSRSIKKPIFPIGFGTEVEDLVIAAHTVDDKIGSITLEGEEFKKFLNQSKANVTLYSKPEHWKEEEYFSHLQTLYNYCLTGRYGIEMPAVEGGCDEWELDYVIAKHEKYLEIYKDPQIIEEPPYGISKWDKIIHYSNAINSLAKLYKKKKDYKKAIKMFDKWLEFNKNHKLSSKIKEYETEIKEIEKEIERGGK